MIRPDYREMRDQNLTFAKISHGLRDCKKKPKVLTLKKMPAAVWARPALPEGGKERRRAARRRSLAAAFPSGLHPARSERAKWMRVPDS